LQLRPAVNFAQHANDLLVREPRFPHESSRLPGSDSHNIWTSGRGERRDGGNAGWSTFCDIEGHFIQEKLLREIVQTIGAARIGDFKEYTSSVFSVLFELYTYRLADRELSLNMKWVALTRYLSAKKSSIHFDGARYVQAVLNTNSLLSRKEAFLSSVDEWKRKAQGDIQNAARGHDLTELLAFSIAAFKGNRDMAKTTVIERILVGLGKDVSTIALEMA
ncbi:MAG: hypothetical protein INH02_01015, partial [Gemmatimonas sp.]|uniref:hypothetical protein n=1 Tax=Gemmatimonas sp. TaxID=1962908 RepID=UPI0025BCDEE0